MSSGKFYCYNYFMLKLGAHLSISGGYYKALENINSKGGNCLQIFSASPRAWNFARPSDNDINDFIKTKSKLKIDPVYFHASYLINLALNNRVGQLSKQLLKHELKLAAKLGVKGSIVHLGSFKEVKNIYVDIISQIKEILTDTPENTLFMIENAGNNKISQEMKEIATIVKEVDSPRLKVCLDTCHLYSAGYDLSTSQKLETFLKEFDSLIDLEKLELFHSNDSKDPFNSGRDRHENIGKGTIPIETFQLIMTHPKLKHLPFIIEVPGFNDEGPDKKNLDILKNLLP